MSRILLLGNPNCGKTTLFNGLTGQNQRVGNWSGVTVEQKSGTFTHQDIHYDIVDLPGIYSLTMADDASLDEQITFNAILNESYDCILQVVDATQLERQLYLTSQLMELGKPLVLALNKMDLIYKSQEVIKYEVLAKQLGCIIIPIEAHQEVGLLELKSALKAPLCVKPFCFEIPAPLNEQLIEFQNDVNSQVSSYFIACRMLEAGAHGMENDLIYIDARYRKIHELVQSVYKKSTCLAEGMTRKLDKWILNRFLGIPIFLLVMYSLFFFAIEFGGVFQDFFDISSEAIFVQSPAYLMQLMHFPTWLIGLVAGGIGRGINTVCAFIPVLAGMYFFLSFLELSGYLARAAFIIDRLMQRLGLPGKSFIPMVMGFGCNVPGIMAARTLKSKPDRVITVLMTPFMSCTARLAIYAVFVEMFFRRHGALIVFSLYLTGIGVAVLTALILRRTLFSGSITPLVLEMPIYQWPSMKRLSRETYIRLKIFMIRASKFIIPVCAVLGVLSIHNGRDHSLLETISYWATPLFAPMGLHVDNWPAMVGLMMGVLAKEVVIGTLNTLYAPLNAFTDSSFSLLGALQEATYSIVTNLSQLGYALMHPLQARIMDQELLLSTKTGLLGAFDGSIGAYAYLLFVLLYMPCVSTMAAVAQETDRRYMWFSIAWSTMIAYAVSVGFYQIATSWYHPLQSLLWLVLLSLGVAYSVRKMLSILLNEKGPYVISAS